ncbi:MKI67 FHA domain-interacting nucleolar phosphoprotein-like [Littorina saxatilis]|uniref:RRM domain-containing protein n=1 Tax=Littorina saxatilis TaxID=31220 RepID=A0AAN9ATR2_9CAEN
MATKHVSEVFVPKTIELDDTEKSKLQTDVQKIKKKKKGGSTTRGVVYLGHIPLGFYEPDMKKFFGQFGRVTRLRLSRSKKTGRSKGYAFVEFLHEDVAKIVASTLNNYLMFMRLLKCEFMPKDKVHPETFKGCHKKFAPVKSASVAADRHNKTKTEAQVKRSQARQTKKSRAVLNKLSEMGIEYSLGGVEKTQSPVPQMIKTPGGKLHVLKEDSGDAEVTFKTPPGAIKSSRLSMTPKVKVVQRRSKRLQK